MFKLGDFMFKSESQRRKFHQLYKEGKISKETLDAWEAETSDSLPERSTNKPTKIKKVKVQK